MKHSKKNSPRLSPEEKDELLALAQSAKLREDMRQLRSHRKSPNLDLYLRFVTEANTFANHAPKPFRRIVDRVMKI